MKIVDTHIHVWDFNKAAYPWLEGDTSILNKTYAIEELEKERAKTDVFYGILVQASNNLEDTRHMFNVAANTSWIQGVVGWLPLTDPKKTAEILEEDYLKNPYFKGVRHLIHNEKDPKWLLQSSVLESLSILAKYNIPYDLVGIHTDHIKTAIEVSKAIPTLKMVLDHLNQPPISNAEQFGYWGELIKLASAQENIYAKISGLGTTSAKGVLWEASDIAPYIKYVISCFGYERCFCGGDWPVSLLAGSYAYAWNQYIKVLEQILDQDRLQKVCFTNAVNFYQLKI